MVFMRTYTGKKLDFCKFEVEEVDINPIIVSKGKFYAVDARMILSKNPKKGFEHLAIMPKKKSN